MFSKKAPLILFLILLLAAILRLYNFPNRYSLGEETVRDAVIGIEAAREIQLPLTGAFSSLGPFTFGPLYAYQLAFASFFLRTVYAPWIYLSIISILYVFVMYKVGEKLFGKIFGLLLALICAISPAQIISATHLTSHNTTNIFAALAIWVFLILLNGKKSKRWYFLLGVLIGTGMNLHYQMVGLLVLPVILSVKQKKANFIYFSVLGVITTFIPLLVFELNNHWFNTRNVIYFLLYDRQRIYVPNRWLFYLRDFWPGFWADALGTTVWFSQLLIALFSAIVAYLFVKRKINKNFLLLIIAFLVNFVLLRYYFGQRFYGYLNFVRPFVFIFTSYIAYFLWQQKQVFLKPVAVLLILLLIIFPIDRIKSTLQKDPFSMQMYTLMGAVKNKLPGKNYLVYGCPTEYNSGYNGELLSAAFISDLNKASAKDTIPLGFTYKKCILSEDEQKAPVVTSGYLKVVDLSSFKKQQLNKEGWKQISFQSIYNDYARWWFAIKP